MTGQAWAHATRDTQGDAHTREAHEARGARHEAREGGKAATRDAPQALAPTAQVVWCPTVKRQALQGRRSSGESRMREPRSNCERDAGERAKERSDWKSHTRKSTHTRMHARGSAGPLGMGEAGGKGTRMPPEGP